MARMRYRGFPTRSPAGTRPMRDTTLRDHLVIVAQLPDFVLGKLDETSLRRVDRHLETCSSCRRELANAMDVLGSLAVTPPPATWVRGAILQRATAEHPAAVQQAIAPSIAVSGPNATGEIGQGLVSATNRGRFMPSGQAVPNWALVASAAVFLVIGSVIWDYEQRNSSTDVHLQDNSI